MGFLVKRIDHVFICPQDWTKSIRFWRDMLGLTVQHDWSRDDYHGASLALGEAHLTLADPEDDRNVEVGFAVQQDRPYLYLQIKGLDACLEHLRNNGAEILAGPVPLHWGPRMVAVRDPAGIPVMLVEWRASGEGA